MKSARRLALMVTLAPLLMFAQPVAASESPIGPPGTQPVPAPLLARDEPVWLVLWGGGSLTENFGGGFFGGLVPFHGDLGTEGFVARIDLSAGSYRYRTSSSEKTYVDNGAGDFMIGYRKDIGSGWLSAYVGPSFETHNNPDPAADVRGTRWGVKGQLEIDTAISDNARFSGFASYSSPFSATFVMARVGFDVAPRITVGPEASAFWHKSYDDQRIGAFAGYHTRYGSLGVSAGYLNAHDSDGDGYYLGAHWSIAVH